jgi:transcriptional regulator with XRE-family HTH domain
VEKTFSFGAWIQQRRKSMRLTQREVAYGVGCSSILIRKIESDERRPSLQIAERMAHFLAIPPDDLPSFLRAARAELPTDRLPAPLSVEPIQATLAYKAISSLPSGNLPTPLSSFIGRQREIAELQALVQQPSLRLITLTGAGGSGKTRLALEVARGVADTYLVC